MTDRIHLHGIEVWAHHGVLPGERERGQPFRLHVELEVDLDAAGRSDDLADTVDYAAVAEDVARAATAQRRDLLEAVARDVADAVLARPQVRAVTVTVDKPHAPLPVAAAGVSVTVRRERAG